MKLEKRDVDCNIIVEDQNAKSQITQFVKNGVELEWYQNIELESNETRKYSRKENPFVFKRIVIISTDFFIIIQTQKATWFCSADERQVSKFLLPNEGTKWGYVGTWVL